MTSRVASMLAMVRAGMTRLTPQECAVAMDAGALLVDIRPVQDRRRHGKIPGAVVIERNVLEWRLDPTSPDRIEEAADAERGVIVFCNEGYASSLAAASLRELGLGKATDMVGGFHAWAASGLPVTYLPRSTVPTPP